MIQESFLYHYTTIENLALILRNRTVRFNKLSNTDDLEESKTGDIGVAGQYIFVSCWTDSSVENVPLWHMYSNKLSGVRIGLPFLPFVEYESELNQNILTDVNAESRSAANSPTFQTYIPNNLVHGENYVITAAFEKNSTMEDIKVLYTDDNSLISPNILKEEDNKLTIKFSLVGKYKRTCWRFQKEFRYRILVLPIGKKEIMLNLEQPDKFESGSKRIKEQVKLDFDFIDLQIDNTSFLEMQIVLGPGINESQKEIINCLIEKFNPKAIVLDSLLNGKIKSKI